MEPLSPRVEKSTAVRRAASRPPKLGDDLEPNRWQSELKTWLATQRAARSGHPMPGVGAALAATVAWDQSQEAMSVEMPLPLAVPVFSISDGPDESEDEDEAVEMSSSRCPKQISAEDAETMPTDMVEASVLWDQLEAAERIMDAQAKEVGSLQRKVVELQQNQASPEIDSSRSLDSSRPRPLKDEERTATISWLGAPPWSSGRVAEARGSHPWRWRLASGDSKQGCDRSQTAQAGRMCLLDLPTTLSWMVDDVVTTASPRCEEQLLQHSSSSDSDIDEESQPDEFDRALRAAVGCVSLYRPPSAAAAAAVNGDPAIDPKRDSRDLVHFL